MYTEVYDCIVRSKKKGEINALIVEINKDYNFKFVYQEDKKSEYYEKVLIKADS